MGKTYKPLDELINSTGYKKSYVAKKMKITPNYLYKIRVKPKKVSVETIESLAKAINKDFLDVYNVIK